MTGISTGQGNFFEHYENYWAAEQRAAEEEKKAKDKAKAVAGQNTPSISSTPTTPSVVSQNYQGTLSVSSSKEKNAPSTPTNVSPTPPNITSKPASVMSNPLPFKKPSRNALQIQHKNKHQQHAPDEFKQKILEIDARITAAVQDEDGQEFLDQLNELLNQPFFREAKLLPIDAFTKAFGILDKCPLDPAEEENAERVKQFETEIFSIAAEAVLITNTKDADKLKEEINKKSIEYLKSTRAGVSNFQSEIIAKFSPEEHDNNKLCSAQKMALETFQNSFRWLVVENSDAGVTLLKRLFVEVIPNLRDHRIAEENAQRRGLRVFEDGLKYLEPDQVADALAEAMDSLGDLSQRFSIRRVNAKLGAPGRHPNRTLAAAGTASLIPVSVTAGLVWPGSAGSAAAVATAAAATGYAAIPIGVFVGGCALAAYLTTEKQAQGTALYMVGRQLNKLRQHWGNVSPENRERLQDSYSNLRNSVDDLIVGVKGTTLTRFFNDPNIDPSKFGEKKTALNERGGQISRFFAPLITRMSSVPTTIDGVKDLSQDEKDLYHLLASYHNEARRLGLSGAKMPVGFIKNLREHANQPEYKEVAKVLLACLIRPRENKTLLGGKEEMPEYRNPITKPKILAQIMEMTRRLAKGKEDFLHKFFNAAKLADENCHVNGRQILSQLWQAVLVDKASRGENGLDKDENLLRLANGLFRVEALMRAGMEVLYAQNDKSKNSEAVQALAAIQIALGKELGLVDAVEGMGYPAEVPSGALQTIRTRFNDLVKKNEFVEFLVAWTPLTDKIKKDPSVNFDARLEEKKEAAKTAFETAHATFLAIDADKLTDKQKEEFDQAGFEFKHSETAASMELLRERINELLDEHPEAMGLTDFSQVNYYSVANEHVDLSEVPNGLDEALWLGFISAITKLKVGDQIDGFDVEDIKVVAKSMYITTGAPSASPAPSSSNLPAPASTKSPISKDDIVQFGFRRVYTEGGGDCMYYALGVSKQNIKTVRAEVAAAIEARPDDEKTRTVNSYQVAGALLQTPDTAHLANLLIRPSVPNKVYAELVKVPGIYSGLDELRAISTLPKYQGKLFLAVDVDGTLTEIQNGEMNQLTYTEHSKTDVLRGALKRAHVRLFKTEQHWERIRDLEKPVPPVPDDEKGKGKE
jgi:hypothetical protein